MKERISWKNRTTILEKMIFEWNTEIPNEINLYCSPMGLIPTNKVVKCELEKDKNGFLTYKCSKKSNEVEDVEFVTLHRNVILEYCYVLWDDLNSSVDGRNLYGMIKSLLKLYLSEMNFYPFYKMNNKPVEN